jgi:adenylate cyclase
MTLQKRMAQPKPHQMPQPPLQRLARRITRQLGALPARRVTWGLVGVFSLWALLDVFVFKLSGGLAKSSFDAMVRARVHAASPDPRIVIIDIDEATLARMAPEFGRWPWPRDTLATVLAHVERQQPAAVVWDVLFSDADRLNPGGDAAFNEAVKRSSHSHFSIARLPQAVDASSQMTRGVLPGLWLADPPTRPAGLPQGAPAATVALIAPALPAIAAGRLGFNNGYVDPDGVLRRYRYVEPLADGSAIQSIALSVMGATKTANDVAHYVYGTSANGEIEGKNELIAWRKHDHAYPRVPFADVFAQAEGGKPARSVPGFAGKMVIIGSTASSLHDIHPTPLSPTMAGVDSLATALDNGLNQRRLRELPPSAQAGLAVALCVGLALWVQFKSAASLAPALLALPAALLVISYLSLNGSPLFLDLHVAAGVALAFLAVLRVWSALRRKHWCSPASHWAGAPLAPDVPEGPQGIPGSAGGLVPGPLAVWAWERQGAWLEAPLDRLIDAIERHAPQCRVVVCDARVTWPATLRWPELARFCAIVGPRAAVHAAQTSLAPVCARRAPLTVKNWPMPS